MGLYGKEHETGLQLRWKLASIMLRRAYIGVFVFREDLLRSMGT